MCANDSRTVDIELDGLNHPDQAFKISFLIQDRVILKNLNL